MLLRITRIKDENSFIDERKSTCTDLSKSISSAIIDVLGINAGMRFVDVIK
jgi:hypothetical protein